MSDPIELHDPAAHGRRPVALGVMQSEAGALAGDADCRCTDLPMRGRGMPSADLRRACTETDLSAGGLPCGCLQRGRP